MATYPDLVHTHLHGRNMLRTVDERRLLRAGVEVYGLDMAAAQRLLREETTRAGVARQVDVDAATRALLTARPSRNGRASRVSSAEFEHIGQFYRARAGGHLPQAEVDGRIKRLMIEEGVAPRAEGWLWRTRGWFDRIPEHQPMRGEPAGPGGGPGRGAPANADGADPGSVTLAVPARAILAAWVERANAVNVAGVVALYAPQGLLLATAAAEPRQGQASIRQYFQTLLAHPRFAVRMGPELASIGQDPVTVSGLYEFSWVDPQGQPVMVPARYTFVLTRPPGPGGGAPDGAILQHHSSALPNRPGSGEV